MLTAVGPRLLGTGAAGEVVAEGFAPVTHLDPDSGRIWDCAEHTKSYLGSLALGQRGGPRRRASRGARLGISTFASRLRAGWSSQCRALAWLWAEGQEGRQAGRRPSRSRRVGVRRRVGAPRDSARLQPHRRPPIRRLAPLGESSTEPRPSGGGSLAEGLEIRLSNPAEASGNGIFGAKGGRNYKVTPSSPGRRNAKGL